MLDYLREVLIQELAMGPFSHSRYGSLTDGLVVIRCQSWLPLASRIVTRRAQLLYDVLMLMDHGGTAEWFAELGNSPIPHGDPEPAVWEDGLHSPVIYTIDHA